MPEARVERTFEAPIDQVWKMWVEPEQFASWYGPPGAVIPTCEMDVELSGRRFIAMEMEGPNGAMQMYFVGEFVEIDPPTRLVYSESLANADGSPQDTSAMPPGAPTSTQVIVELTDVGGTSTEVIVRHVGIPADSPGAMGWQLALGKLAARLADSATSG